MNKIFDSGDPTLFDVRTSVPGPKGSLPITAEMLLNRPSGDLFGLSQDAEEDLTIRPLQTITGTDPQERLPIRLPISAS